MGGIPARAGDPLLGLRAAGMAAARGLTLSPATVGALADRPVPAFPWGTAARELFGCLLAAEPGLGPVWEPLARAGVIDRWLPCWSGVRGVLQISAVHRHTVDRHQLETVACCAVLLPGCLDPTCCWSPRCCTDIGKTSANRAELADHGELGAPGSGQAARDLGFDAADAAVIEVLVRRHLVLAELATARDPRDPATIEDLLTAVDSDPLALELLWALTEADARATGGPAWSTARRAAIAALARTAQRLLSRRLPPALPLPDSTPPPPGLLGAVTGDGPQVRLEPSVTAGAVYALVTAAADRAGLFADIAALLAAAGLQVRARPSSPPRTGSPTIGGEVDPVDAARPDPGALTRRLRRLEAGDGAVLRGMATRPVVVDRLNGSPMPIAVPRRGRRDDRATPRRRQSRRPGCRGGGVRAGRGRRAVGAHPHLRRTPRGQLRADHTGGCAAARDRSRGARAGPARVTDAQVRSTLGYGGSAPAGRGCGR